MEIIINGTRVEGDIEEIMMTDAYGNVSILKSSGANERRRRVNKGERFHYIDSREHIIEVVDIKDSYCDELYKVNNYYLTAEDAEKEARRRRMRREFRKYFNRHGDYTLIYKRGSRDIRIVKRCDINLYRIGDFIFMEKDIDNVQKLIEEYGEDILEEYR